MRSSPPGKTAVAGIDKLNEKLEKTAEKLEQTNENLEQLINSNKRSSKIQKDLTVAIIDFAILQTLLTIYGTFDLGVGLKIILLLAMIVTLVLSWMYLNSGLRTPVEP